MHTIDIDAPARPVRDLADFHLRWPEFRPDVLKLAKDGGLPEAKRETLLWLVRLADRIGARDLT